jgi:hypothetical protein
MGRREEWRRVLESEVGRWSLFSYEALLDRLRNPACYTVERGSKSYQVEVEVLAKTDTSVHVSLSVDDGSLPASLIPSSTTFVVKKTSPQT